MTACKRRFDAVPNRLIETRTVNRAAIAAFALGAAMLFPNWAAAHELAGVMLPPPIVAPHEHDQLTRETLPIVHDCPQVPATIRAQDMTEDEFDAACMIFMETEDYFHAKMQTDPAHPTSQRAAYDLHGRVEVLAFNTREEMNEFFLEVYGQENVFVGRFRFTIRNNSYSDIIFISKEARPVVWAHEYVHYLDVRFIMNRFFNHWPRSEGLAEYLTRRDDYPRAIRLIGDGSTLPSLLDIWRQRNTYDFDVRYRWGYLVTRFLFEEYPKVYLDTVKITRASYRNWRASHDAYYRYVNQAFPPLTSDFHRWLRKFTRVTAVPIEAVTVFVGVAYYRWAGLRLADYFVTSQQDLTFDVSLSVPYEQQGDWLVSDIVHVTLFRDGQWLRIDPRPRQLGTAEVTVIATAPDGQSAQLTFTVNVVQDLETTAITLRDAVSTVESETAINLDNYYTGPALSDVEFTVASNKPDVARVAVRDGRLVITAVAAGEAEVTVRTDYYGRQTTQIFTVTITDDCPSYLCRGFFNGWRWLLLEGGEATPATPTE